MSYTRQNFTNGQVLTADHLNKIDEALSNEALQFGEQEVYIMPETELTFEAQEALGGLVMDMTVPLNYDLIAGNTYKAKFDGVEYTCVAGDLDGALAIGNMAVMGGADTGEPFLFIQSDMMFGVMPIDTTKTSAVMSVVGKAIKRIDSAYAPENPFLDLYNIDSDFVVSDNPIYTNLPDISVLKSAAKTGFIRVRVAVDAKYSLSIVGAGNNVESSTSMDSPIDVIAECNYVFGYYWITKIIANRVMYIRVTDNGYAGAQFRTLSLT